MPVSFARLRIAGFKSFAEAAVVEILPGLTGIVGPNGCGKSNVVEALRWAMGESSARSLRGGEMDDVIFAGTAHRPSRNIAEVVLTLEEAQGQAPPPWHEAAELEISRRIEREAGSVYRVNGREARARDVQTLFADLASGARASAMISQGRVGALVSAKPDERRMLLEEAAGITGLHARRHEAELKLRATEANLARAEDLRIQLEAQGEGLKRQAREAERYRTVSTAIRTTEMELLALQRARVATAREAAEVALHAAGMAVAEAVTAATARTAEAAETASLLPALRESEGQARTDRERARIEGEQSAQAEARAREALGAAAKRLGQIGDDLAHAERLNHDAAAADTRLVAEAVALAEAAAAHPVRAAAAVTAAAEAADAAAAADTAALRAVETAASVTARTAALGQQLGAAEARQRRGAETLARHQRERAAIVAIDPAALAAAEVEQAGAQDAEQRQQAELATAEQARVTADAAQAAARETAAGADAARTKLAAEVQALIEVLAAGPAGAGAPVVDSVEAPPGLETALGAALGEDLEASEGEGPRHWRALPPWPVAAWPAGCEALAGLVKGPPCLARALSSVGLAESSEAAAAAQAGLDPGRVLVTREGGLWRADGFVSAAGTPSAAAVRLQQRNRLAARRVALAEADVAAREAGAAREAAQVALREAASCEHQARTARRDGEQRLARARADFARLSREAAAAAARIAALEDSLAAATAESAEAQAALAELQAVKASLPDADAARAAVTEARARLAAARAAEAAAASERDTLHRLATERAARLEANGRERAEWRSRAVAAASRIAELSARRDAAAAEHDALADAPAHAAERRRGAIEAQEASEAAHRRASDALAAAESAAAAAERAARSAEAALTVSRDAVGKAELEQARALHDWGSVAERILERFGANPALPDPPSLGPDGEERLRRRLERLQREREGIGPVNLRAELEAGEIATRVAGIVAERDELNTAIAKLRGSIGHLNREGRERLNAVFAEVDRHFQALFARMFGGGRAHLGLVGSDDPLLAGLEIYAQPPGKKLATLSLLSGGEQALTALSLIFAVFRCNPAPICVLDEVDAPLDDANVDRFCTLLDDMVRETGTRFLVVTHHPLTMARMDRLYGVTMQERGVSRLLSVDLGAAVRFAEAAE